MTVWRSQSIRELLLRAAKEVQEEQVERHRLHSPTKTQVEPQHVVQVGSSTVLHLSTMSSVKVTSELVDLALVGRGGHPIAWQTHAVNFMDTRGNISIACAKYFQA